LAGAGAGGLPPFPPPPPGQIPVTSGGAHAASASGVIGLAGAGAVGAGGAGAGGAGAGGAAIVASQNAARNSIDQTAVAQQNLTDTVVQGSQQQVAATGRFAGAMNKLGSVLGTVGLVMAGLSLFGSAVDFIGGLFMDEEKDLGMTTVGEGLGGVLAENIRKSTPEVSLQTELMAKQVRSYLPGSDAERGPLSDLTQSAKAIPTTFTEGIRSGVSEVTSATKFMSDRTNQVLKTDLINTSESQLSEWNSRSESATKTIQEKTQTNSSENNNNNRSSTTQKTENTKIGPITIILEVGKREFAKLVLESIESGTNIISATAQGG
jgi:hypothetical protein